MFRESDTIPSVSITIAIPTLGREQVLIETLEYLLQYGPNCELLLVDQTVAHESETQARLDQLVASNCIRVVTQSPSIPRAMNRALQEATGEIVLFLDDDIIPSPELVTRHLESHREEGVVAVVGQVLQPGESAEPIEHPQTNGSTLMKDIGFCFRSTIPANVSNVMAGNLSVKRKAALAAGGFDENFVGVAYRFETEFARRLSRVGVIRYQPLASIRHLAAARGGTRTFGRHLTTALPFHSVGDYYFALLEGKPFEAFTYCARRLLTSCLTRFHAKHPWYIPLKIIGELRGLLWAIGLRRSGQRLVHNAPIDDSKHYSDELTKPA